MKFPLKWITEFFLIFVFRVCLLRVPAPREVSMCRKCLRIPILIPLILINHIIPCSRTLWSAQIVLHQKCLGLRDCVFPRISGRLVVHQLSRDLLAYREDKVFLDYSLGSTVVSKDYYTHFSLCLNLYGVTTFFLFNKINRFLCFVYICTRCKESGKNREPHFVNIILDFYLWSPVISIDSFIWISHWSLFSIKKKIF